MDASEAYTHSEDIHRQPVAFKEEKETWGSEYEITEGKYKGFRVSCKLIVERIYETGKTDDVGLPIFDVSHHPAIRVLPPSRGFRPGRKK